MLPFGNDALLLIAHGSARYPDAGRAVLRHAARIRDHGRFAAVAVGFLNGQPSVADARATLSPHPIHVVPFFMEDGYFTRVAVPKALDGATGLHVYPPVGTHAGMGALIAACIREGRAIHGPADIILVGHGSARTPGRRTALHDHAERVGAGLAFLEESPSLTDALARVRGEAVAVLGIFAGAGGHVRDDLPAAIAQGRQRFRGGLFDLGSIGERPEMVDLILDRVAGG